ncbi:MAG: hypothetical protein PHO63_00390 [Bacilli bacterium]|nr:hypothetical protein [Bacilli bacterium]MDD4808672.1 hypothetical protein [Bacilli bacterium]
MLGTLTYIAPFMVANGATAYTISKMNEKKTISKFDNLKIIKATPITTKPIVPVEIKDLVKKIEENIDHDYLNNLYTNLSNVKINKKLSLLFLGIKGQYSSLKNTLNYSLNSSLEHELLHLASSHYDKENDLCQSGFVNYDKGFTLCKALNEGYTDLMARRIFNKKTTFYDGEVRLAEFFELLFDKDELQKYYFNNDLVSFINKLSTFIGREEAIKILIKFDLGFDLKKLSNPAYKVIYTDLELKLSEIFMNSNKPISKQFDHLDLLDKSPITKTMKKIKKR